MLYLAINTYFCKKTSYMKIFIPALVVLIFASCTRLSEEESDTLIEYENPDLIFSTENHTYSKNEKGQIIQEWIVYVYYNTVNETNNPIDSNISEVRYEYKSGQLSQKKTYVILFNRKEISKIERFSNDVHEMISFNGKDTNHHHIKYYKNKVLYKSIYDDRFSGMDPTYNMKKYLYKGKNIEKQGTYNKENKLVGYTVYKYEKNRLVKREEFDQKGDLLSYSETTNSKDYNIETSTWKTKYGKTLSVNKIYYKNGVEVAYVNSRENENKDSMALENKKETYYISENLKNGDITREEYKYNDEGLLIEVISYLIKK